MSRYHVVIMGREAPELLTREGYASKGEARRAWATAARGAVLIEDGMVVDEKTGTTKTTAAALRRFVAKLELDRDEERDEELEEEALPDRGDEEEPEEAAPPLPARASKVRAGHCPSCDEVLPDHLSTCPSLPAAMPPKGFEFDDQTEKGFFEPSTRVETMADVEAIIARDDVLAETREVLSTCAAKGCEAPTGKPRANTPREFACLCPGHRQAARFVMRNHDLDRAGAVERMREHGAPAHIRKIRAAAASDAKKVKPPPRKAEPKTRRGAGPEALSLTDLRTLVETALHRDVELIVRSGSAILRCVASGPIATGSNVPELAHAVLPKIMEELDGARGRLRLAEDRIRTARSEVEQGERAIVRLRAAGAGS